MPYTIEAEVVEVKADFDPFGNAYVQVTFAYKLEAPANQAVAGVPAQTAVYKHAMHLIVPKTEWRGQYNMWERVLISVSEDGTVQVKKVKVETAQPA